MYRKPLLSLVAGILFSLFPSCSGSSEDYATVEFIAGERNDGETIRLYADQTTLDKVVEALSAIYPNQSGKGLPGLRPCVNNLFAYTYPDPNPTDSWDTPYLSDLFKIENGDIRQVAQGFRAIGFMNCGRIPVVRPGEAPVILDTELKEVFKAEEVDGVPVESVASAYSEGLLWFALKDGNGGCFDTEGNVAFTLNHEPLMPAIRSDQYFVDGFVFMLYNQTNATIDKSGEVMWRCKGGQRVGNSIFVTDCDMEGWRVTLTQYSPSGEVIREEVLSDNSDTKERELSKKDIEEAFDMTLINFLPFDLKHIVNISGNDSIRIERLSACNDATSLLKHSLRSDVPRQTPKFEFSALKHNGTSDTSGDLVLNDKGLGSITLGMEKGSIPASAPGLYDSKSYTRINHDEFLDCPESIDGYYTCKLNGKSTCHIYVDTTGKVCGIYVTAPAIESADGVKVGMSTSSIKKTPGSHFETDDLSDETFYYGKSGVTHLVDGSNKIKSMAIGVYY